MLCSNMQAKDSEVGTVDDFTIVVETCAICCLVVDTTNLFPCDKGLISRRWIERISWEESQVFINLTREAIQNGPEYTDQTLITRDHETRLHRHYNREGYWADDLAAHSPR